MKPNTIPRITFGILLITTIGLTFTGNLAAIGFGAGTAIVGVGLAIAAGENL